MAAPERLAAHQISVRHLGASAISGFSSADSDGLCHLQHWWSDPWCCHCQPPNSLNRTRPEEASQSWDGWCVMGAAKKYGVELQEWATGMAMVTWKGFGSARDGCRRIPRPMTLSGWPRWSVTPASCLAAIATAQLDARTLRSSDPPANRVRRRRNGRTNGDRVGRYVPHISPLTKTWPRRTPAR